MRNRKEDQLTQVKGKKYRGSGKVSGKKEVNEKLTLKTGSKKAEIGTRLFNAFIVNKLCFQVATWQPFFSHWLKKHTDQRKSKKDPRPGFVKQVLSLERRAKSESPRDTLITTIRHAHHPFSQQFCHWLRLKVCTRGRVSSWRLNWPMSLKSIEHWEHWFPV